ncbi:Protein indeterminate-domain 7, partial [Mucuna pruriens]
MKSKKRGKDRKCTSEEASLACVLVSCTCELQRHPLVSSSTFFHPLPSLSLSSHTLTHHTKLKLPQVASLVVEEKMSNLTSASSEISASSGIRNENGSLYAQFSSTSINQEPPQPKKKRSLPGHPEPGAEVIALTPQTLLATNRFVCEICNKGFQRDQNLQLHRRGHNLPWKLKKKNSKEARKKVYVCPEETCVHHDPSRALGDLTGIKKHFFRKHGEKKWKCDKCSKRYAVQSDWKAHFKVCGTREYKCDCGTLFSRRDSFITHRAFCDALAQESIRTVNPHPHPHPHHPLLSSTYSQFPRHALQAPSLLKREQEFNFLSQEIPSWLASPPAEETIRSLDFSTPHANNQSFVQHENPNPTLVPSLSSFPYSTSPSPHMSATALLQKASQIGATVSSSAASEAMLRPHLLVQQVHVPECSSTIGYYMAPSSAVSGTVMPSREEIVGTCGFARGLAS